MSDLTHLDKDGKARMVDVSEKKETHREAVAQGRVFMSPETLKAIGSGETPKGDVLAAARLAGIGAAKRTWELIPLCHPLRLTDINVDLTLNQKENSVDIRAHATAVDRTGVEMEAMTAVSVAALTIYDMCKAMDRSMTISHIQLLEKSGGRSGHWVRSEQDPDPRE